MATYLEQSLAQLKHFEGCIPWMYQDTTGNVTVGVGAMLPTPQAAAALPFELSGAPTSAHEITAEFQRVAALPRGRLPAFYRSADSPELPLTAIEDRLHSVLLTFETDLRRHLPRYDTLPDRAKLALLDMSYNLGVTGLLHGYPRLIAAVIADDWPKAAAESLRHGISSGRNTWTRLEFLAAAAETGVVGDIQAAAAEFKLFLRWCAAATAIAAAAALLGWLALRATRPEAKPPGRKPPGRR